MPDAIFAHPRLAAVYDAFDEPRDDLDNYLRICTELGATSVIDVGCGTGSLALLLAGHGFEVTGVDPAAASLDVGRGKPGAAAISWLHGDARDVAPAVGDVAVMTGNVAQVFCCQTQWQTTLHAVHRALNSRGYLVFETRRPERRVWEDWRADTATERVDVAGVGAVERRFELTDVDAPLVSFRYTYTFACDGAVIASESTLIFRSRAEIEQSLAECGYEVVDVRDAPDRPGLEYVFIAQRTS